MVNENDNGLQLFIDESREHLTGIEEDLLAIEKGGQHASPAIVDKVFRAIHTIKGSASFFALTKIKELSHAMESILSRIRSKKLVPDGEIVTALLDGADALRTMIDDIKNADQTDIHGIVSKLELYYKNEEFPVAVENNHTDPKMDSISGYVKIISPVSGIRFEIKISKLYTAQQLKNGRFVYLLEIKTATDSFAKNKTESSLIAEINEIAMVIDKKSNTTENELAVICVTSMDSSIFCACIDIPPERIIPILTGKIVKTPEKLYSLCGVSIKGFATVIPEVSNYKNNEEKVEMPVQAESSQVRQNAVQAVTNRSLPIQEGSLRVNIVTLDRLMILAGEMVLTRNELLQNASSKNLPKILAASQRVDTITSELQEAIMSTRMQSIGIVLSKFRRVVRDLASQLQKQVQVIIEGEDVELDKSIIEAVGDPLTHIVRNAIDHGIETPDVREQCGKPTQGTIHIRACHEAGQVMIEIVDDGKGIDPAVIRKKARNLGLYDDNELASMNDREVIKIIFKPGFSTSEKITDISGRGVGMDVVLNNLKKVGGAVDIDSVAGKGTTLRIKLPLTLAIIPSLLVIVEDKTFAIPQTNVVELVRIAASDVKRRIEMVGGAAVVRLRNELLPLVRTSDVLGISQRTFSNETELLAGKDRRMNVADRRTLTTEDVKNDKRITTDRRKSPFSAVSIVVVTAGDFKYGLIVDSLLDSSEIVVKPLGYHLCDCREYAGATILGDGQVALILDVVGIRRQLELKDTTEVIAKRMAQQKECSLSGNDHQPFLIIKNNDDEFFAIPVGLIARIEKIREDAIKDTGGKQVVQYRGGSLRLFSIDEFANVKTRQKKQNAYMIVFQIGDREAGIVISEVIDTQDIFANDIDNMTHVQTGIIGSAVVSGSITLILDIFGIVKACAPEFATIFRINKEKESPGTILIVEDSLFFINQIKAFIEDAGYDTVCAENGVEALDVLKKNNSIDLVITDIEMPGMDGLELTRRIRSDETLKHLPIIAVTSVNGEKAERAGLEAGINEYLIKLDRDKVLNTCKKYLMTRVKENV
jgi:two-component system, chemotaxis family, sensor kinase CheA